MGTQIFLLDIIVDPVQNGIWFESKEHCNGYGFDKASSIEEASK